MHPAPSAAKRPARDRRSATPTTTAHQPRTADVGSLQRPPLRGAITSRPNGPPCPTLYNSPTAAVWGGQTRPSPRTTERGLPKAATHGTRGHPSPKAKERGSPKAATHGTPRVPARRGSGGEGRSNRSRRVGHPPHALENIGMADAAQRPRQHAEREAFGVSDAREWLAACPLRLPPIVEAGILAMIVALAEDSVGTM